MSPNVTEMSAVTRITSNPILHVGQDTGSNINGPSLIKVPNWIDNPLGRYYLYFAQHHGSAIRLAFADRVEGPWRVYERPVLDIAATLYRHHIGSPDVHVDDRTQTMLMYYHGGTVGSRPIHGTSLAISANGIDFVSKAGLLGGPYWRAFKHNGMWYAVAKLGIRYRASVPDGPFETGPALVPSVGLRIRHLAVMVYGDTLFVCYSRIGDCPESILLSKVNLDVPWTQWQATSAKLVLEPKLPYEGLSYRLRPSERGAALTPVRELRDPALYREDDTVYLLYSVAGEQGIAVAIASLKG